MPTTRRQRSRTQTRLRGHKKTGNGHQKPKPASSKSRSRSGRKSDPTESRTRSGRKYHPTESRTRNGRKYHPAGSRTRNGRRYHQTESPARKRSEQPLVESCRGSGNGNRKTESQTRSGRKYHVGIEDNTVERRPVRSLTRNLRVVYAQELRKRIAAIPIKGRQVPETDDLKALGLELKLRLATNCDIISENGRRGGKVKVMTIYSTHRFVPIWEINKQQDPTLLCEVKVKVKPQRQRNHS